jgi:hypothetical protein
VTLGLLALAIGAPILIFGPRSPLPPKPIHDSATEAQGKRIIEGLLAKRTDDFAMAWYRLKP